MVTSDKIIEEYRQNAQKILERMYKIVVRAHRKVDDSKYRTVLAKLEKEK